MNFEQEFTLVLMAALLALLSAIIGAIVVHRMDKKRHEQELDHQKELHQQVLAQQERHHEEQLKAQQGLFLLQLKGKERAAIRGKLLKPGDPQAISVYMNELRGPPAVYIGDYAQTQLLIGASYSSYWVYALFPGSLIALVLSIALWVLFARPLLPDVTGDRVLFTFLVIWVVGTMVVLVAGTMAVLFAASWLWRRVFKRGE